MQLQPATGGDISRWIAYFVLSGSRESGQAAPSALALAGDLVDCFAGWPSDLSSNPRHSDGFGQP
jgi:hypothetical protein